MHLRSLKIYCDIVDRRSFSRAAAENDISQSAASQVVQQIEERLGVKLLDRSRRPFVLTPEGRQYYEGGRHLVRQYEDLEQRVRNADDEIIGRVTVAAIFSVGLAHMSKYVQEFISRYPRAHVRMEYLHPDRVYEAVEQGDAEIGILSYPRPSRRLASSLWRSEPMAVVCPPCHRISQKREVPLSALRGERFVAFEHGLRIRDEIEHALARQHVEVTTVLEFDNLETIKRAIEVGSGISVLPTPTIEREVSLGLLVGVPLVEPPLVRPLGIIHQRDRPLSSTADRFVQLLKDDVAAEQQDVALGRLGSPSADFVI